MLSYSRPLPKRMRAGLLPPNMRPRMTDPQAATPAQIDPLITSRWHQAMEGNTIQVLAKTAMARLPRQKETAQDDPPGTLGQAQIEIPSS